jgi:hypothetical protein
LVQAVAVMLMAAVDVVLLAVVLVVVVQLFPSLTAMTSPMVVVP